MYKPSSTKKFQPLSIVSINTWIPPYTAIFINGNIIPVRIFEWRMGKVKQMDTHGERKGSARKCCYLVRAVVFPSVNVVAVYVVEVVV